MAQDLDAVFRYHCAASHSTNLRRFVSEPNGHDYSKLISLPVLPNRNSSPHAMYQSSLVYRLPPYLLTPALAFPDYKPSSLKGASTLFFSSSVNRRVVQMVSACSRVLARSPILEG